MSLSKEDLCHEFCETCKRGKHKSPPTYLFFQDLFSEWKLCQREDLLQSSSGLGIYYKLGKGQYETIGRRYVFCLEANKVLKQKFFLPECRLIFFVSDEKTSTSVVQTKNIFVCVPFFDIGGVRISKCKVISYICLETGEIVKEPEAVYNKCVEFKKQPKPRKPRKVTVSVLPEADPKEPVGPFLSPDEQTEPGFYPPPITYEGPNEPNKPGFCPPPVPYEGSNEQTEPGFCPPPIPYEGPSAPENVVPNDSENPSDSTTEDYDDLEEDEPMHDDSNAFVPQQQFPEEQPQPYEDDSAYQRSGSLFETYDDTDSYHSFSPLSDPLDIQDEQQPYFSVDYPLI